MRAILTATALAGALAVTPLAALAQQESGQAGAPETQATPTPEAQTPETQAGEGPEGLDYRVITTAADFEGLDFGELRIEPVDEVPRDQVMAINSSLDPTNQEAAALREELNQIEEVQQALSEEDIDEERVVGAAIDENDLVVYVLPEGENRESWAAEMPAPTGDSAPAGADADRPGEAGAADADQQPGEAGAAGSGQQPSGGTNY